MGLFLMALAMSFAAPLKALPFLPKVYIVGAGTYTKLDPNMSHTHSGFVLGLGVSGQGLPVPVVNGFRLQGTWAHTGRNLYSLGLYYDFHMLPVVTPYLGTSVSTSDLTNITKKDSYNLWGVHLGLAAGIPFVPLSVFAEYKYGLHLGGTQKYHTNTNANMFLLGIRFYLL